MQRPYNRYFPPILQAGQGVPRFSPPSWSFPPPHRFFVPSPPAPSNVIPAKAGIQNQWRGLWIPAFARMTKLKSRDDSGRVTAT